MIQSNVIRKAALRQALRQRVNQMYAWFNRCLWAKCLSLVDPQLKQQSRVDPSSYAKKMQAFREFYGKINPWHVRISMHLTASSNKQDARPFAYVYVVWQDDKHQFHMFKERWVKERGRWFTRVVGLVPNKSTAA